MRETLFGADGADHFSFGIERYPKPILVIASDCFTEFRNTSARGIPMIARVVRCFGQLLNSNVGRREVWVAETKINNIVACPSCFNLQRVDDGEDIRWQRIDSAELHTGKVS